MDQQLSKKIAQQYDRIASKYNMIDWIIPASWRKRAIGKAFGRVLEVGIGTGLNLPFYPPNCWEVYGIDLSSQMLVQAQKVIPRCSASVTLATMDVQDLPFEEDRFDCVTATLVFCTVPDPLQGLQECYRVLKPGGKLILMEHVGSNGTFLRSLMDLFNPLMVTLLDDHINRDTTQTVAAAGFTIETEEHLWLDVFRLIVVTK